MDRTCPDCKAAPGVECELECVGRRTTSLPNREPYSPTQCAYAMRVLLRRLIDEGYIVDNRQTELLERARNHANGSGFLTDAELSAPTPTEDLLS